MAELTPGTPATATVSNDPKPAKATRPQKAASNTPTPAAVVEPAEAADAPYRRVYLSYTSGLSRFVDSQTHLVVTKEPQVVPAARVGHACLCELAVVVEPVMDPA